MLPTASVKVWGPRGDSVVVRAILDTGAQGCLLSSWLAGQVGLDVSDFPGNIQGVGETAVTTVEGKTWFEITPVSCLYPKIGAPALILPNILGTHPQRQLSLDLLRLTSGLDLADPRFDSPCTAHLLLGSDVLGRIMLGNTRVLQPETPWRHYRGLVAISTIFGFVVMGPVLKDVPLPEPDFVLASGSALSDAVQRFWQVEEPPQVAHLNPEHEECELFYQNNTGRLRSGRLVTRLPFVAVRPPLGQSRSTAERRLLAMERRMARDPVLRQKYLDFMREYADLGHMSVSNLDWRSVEHYFLPHHAVLKPSTGKLRTVFDGSARTSSGVSLNDCLHSGPKLLRDLCDVITCFRRHQVVFVADIKMMFRQTVIHQDDRRYQLILWRENPQEPMIVYELNTNTYGLRSSPFVAIRSLWELADRERLKFPRASAILKTDLYVDDVCTGAPTVEEAILLRDELVQILASAGYELRKWVSNSPALLEGVLEDHRQDPHLFENVDNPAMMAVLGVQYRPVQDTFTYDVELESPHTWTKRLVLSTVARTFDPNGWICPVLFWAKCFLQRLWTAELGWDEPLRETLLEDWLQFVSSLPAVNEVALSRAILPPGSYTATLHGFCDASSHGYAAVVYLRTVSATGQVKLSLLMAKSKVAPLRTAWTIPKLELSGATLLVRLLNHVAHTLGGTVDIRASYAWTDSQIVLCWLKTSVHSLEVFVANRVSQIQNSETPLIWRHVPGDLNPGDVASRGCMAPRLIVHPLWWGPDWLTRPEVDWPRTPVLMSDPVPGLKVLAVGSKDPPFDPDFLLNRYSSLDKLLKVTSWIRRFGHNSRNPGDKLLSPVLSPQERQESLLLWVRFVQAAHFEKEIETLKTGKIKLSGAVSKLNPFLDKSGLLRVGGRLRHSSLPYGARHPLLLPKEGHLIQLLVTDRHIGNSHAGCNALLAILQREFWILSARRTIRSIVFRCMPCYRTKASTMQPLMGDLPADRVNEARPFAGVGTDFAGPFSVKTSTLRNSKIVKAYLCVFVCLSTKAVHLELVTSLSTEAFVATLDRFVSRRGLPSLIRSDCGTNYKGTSNYLKEVYAFLNESQVDIGNKLARRGVTWLFDPPACPHWGGIFEAAVKAAKGHWRRLLGDTVLTFEELATVFCRIEAVLNSRPLCPLSSDPNDLEALTPGHFLIGQPLVALPEYPLVDVSHNRLSRFQLVQQLAQSFWRRWSLEYLHILQQRVKWTDKSHPPKIGDLVLIKDANLKPLHWRRGRILNLVTGSDGVPRFAEVLVDGSVMKRAVATLSRLPID